MGESMERINRKVEALPHEAPLSSYKIQAFIAEHAFAHREREHNKPDEYDSMPKTGNTVMKWWMDKSYSDKYREYIDDEPNATIDPHSEEQLTEIMKKFSATRRVPATKRFTSLH